MKSSKQARKISIPAFLITVLAVSMIAVYITYSYGNQLKADPKVYVGVDFCGNTTEQAKVLIDRVRSYTNLFILDSGRNPISENQSSVEEIGNYAVSQGLSVILNLGIKDVTNPSSWNWFWQHQSLDGIKQDFTQMWGDKFLGVYYNDEPGGLQLDANWTKFYLAYGEDLCQIYPPHPASVALYQEYLKLWNAMINGTFPRNYNLETNFFVQTVLRGDPGLQNLTAAGIPTFTSDYGLYWFDYLGGYDVMFAELGWNVSVAEQIALVKGAARLQDKDWGTIITWKYDSAPYLDSGDQIYNQMLTSYESGAKYITIFNFPYEGNSYGAMTDEHFNALQRFWIDITSKKFEDLSKPDAALVLPTNFGFGMRNPNDTIWGFWTTDNRTLQIAIVTSKLLTQYGARLDIVYDETNYPITKVNYQQVYYWNQTGLGPLY
jgi:hypothetical protein